MKKHLNATTLHRRFKALAAFLFLIPAASYAATDGGPIQLSMTSYLLLAFLLVFSLIMFFIFQRRFNVTRHELRDLTSELDLTRKRLTETAQELELSQKDHKATTNRYQGILFDAEVGMFQIDATGTCIYVNNAMQKLSGLYLKKAQKEGLSSAVHPEDRSRFEEAWNRFVEGSEPFNDNFRFQHKLGREIHEAQVSCRANKVFNAKKEVESYIGWVTDVTHFHTLLRMEQTRTGHYRHFVNETIEGYFQLVPEEPIPLSPTASKMADAIMEKMVMAECNDTFAAMYGADTDELQGKGMNELPGGCGPFRNKQNVVNFVESGYKTINIESVKQDMSGNRLNLINDVVGIVEDNKLVGIWGAQRNVTHQKREKAELSSQIRFMNRILNTLPADVHVKDTRCRYLYASKKLADRTGISQEEWIGKTIFEVMPGTSRDHDQRAVETMKTGKLNRAERPYEARGKSGWMETIQIPLVSEEGLVEGVVGLSLEVTERKNREEEARQKYATLESVLMQTRNDLTQSRNEYSKTATSLSEATRRLKIAEAEKLNREHEFKEHLAERKHVEETLRRSEESLLTRQNQLEEQLSKRLAELEMETDKRKKWEELLSIKEEEMCKAESLVTDLGRQLSESEDFLQSTQEQLIQITEQHAAEIEKEVAARKAAADHLSQIQQQLEHSDANWKKEIESINARNKSELDRESKVRAAAEKELAKVEDLLQKTQEEIKELTERHSRELEDEVAERKTAAEKLMQSMEDLDELRQQFNVRIEEETRTIKQELAQKQIREKALRQHEKDLEERIKELESSLQMKSKEFAEQIQAREGAEVQKQQIEQRLEQMTKRQQELVARETQKLQLHIAEIRLDEIKLRKQAGDLQREKESLEELLQERNSELERLAQKQHGTDALLSETKTQLMQLSDNQDKLIAAETEALRHQLVEVKHHGETLQKQLSQLQQDKKTLDEALASRNTELDRTTQNFKQAKTALAETEARLKQVSDNQSKLIESETSDLCRQLEQMQQASDKLRYDLEQLRNEKQNVEKNLEIRTQDLGKAAREYRKVVDAYKGTQAKLKELAENQEAALAQKTKGLVDELDQLHRTETELHTKCQKMEAHIDEQQKRIVELSSNLSSETAKREQVDKDLQDLRIAMESDKENAVALVEEQTKSLKNRIDELTSSEERLKQELNQAKQSIIQRDEARAAMKAEQEQTEARIKEVETRLSGIREEHQAELKKSMAEVKKISQLNGALVDELNDALQTALNPVVKTAIQLEKAENLSPEQKQDIVKTNITCRSLIDMMNYRCELTHIADGSDKVEIGRCDLHGLMTDVDRQFSHRAETKKLFFAVSFAQYQTAHNVPKHVETDELKIRKVLSILLGYAIEKTDKGRLGLHATRNSCSDNTANISFEMAYTGKDHSDSLLDAIFGTEQAESEVVDVKFGLTLARRYIAMLNGEFTLEYRQGGITALTLQFPFKKVGSEAIAPENNEKKAGAA